MKKFLAAIAMTALAATSVNAATILVGTDAGYAPYEYKDPQTNEIVGFDIDLIKAIAKATGNVAAAGMTITPERQKQVTFSDPYYDVGGLIMAVHAKNVDKYKHMNDLEGKRVCAQIGSTGALLAKEIKDAKLVAFDQTGEAFMELKMGGCEAVLVDKIVTEFYLAHKAEKDIVLVPHLYTHKQNGFAMAKGNEKMHKIINTGLKTIKENGEYDKIYEKWFGKKPEKK